MLPIVLEIDWSSFVDHYLFQVNEILSWNAVIYIDGVFVKHINWDYMADLCIKTIIMRIKYTKIIDKIERRIPEEGEEPRPGLSWKDIEDLEHQRDEAINLLNMGDAKLRAFKWDDIVDSHSVPTMDHAVSIVKKVCDYTPIV